MKVEAGASTLGIGKGSMVDWRGGDTQIGASGDTYSWGYEVQGNLFHNGAMVVVTQRIPMMSLE